jgi:hypothetical protein
VIQAMIEAEVKKLHLNDNDDGKMEIVSSDRKEAYKTQAKPLVNRYEDGLKIIDFGKVNWKRRSNVSLAKLGIRSVSR